MYDILFFVYLIIVSYNLCESGRTVTRIYDFYQMAKRNKLVTNDLPPHEPVLWLPLQN